jgi:hypothetical protein
MSRRSSTAAGLLTAALALAAALPTLAAGQDLRSPDARDAASRATTPGGPRSPDSRDTNPAGVTVNDLRSPDARDAASRGRDTGSAFTWPPVRLRSSPRDQPATLAATANATDDGTGITRTTIGLAVAGGLLAIGGIAAVNTRRSRRRQRLRATV